MKKLVLGLLLLVNAWSFYKAYIMSSEAEMYLNENANLAAQLKLVQAQLDTCLIRLAREDYQ